MLAALALGMPHGAADTELLRAGVARLARGRHAALLGRLLRARGRLHGRRQARRPVGRAGGAARERRALRRGRAGLLGPAPAGRPAARAALRLLAAAVATVGLPAAVGTAERGVAGASGSTGVLDAPPPRAVGDRTGVALLRDPATAADGRAVPAALAVGSVAALALSGDREAAGDTARLTALALLAPPSLAFAGYFGGWHALRHTARVTDALVADGALPDPGTLPRAVAVLGRRSAWAARRRAARVRGCSPPATRSGPATTPSPRCSG